MHFDPSEVGMKPSPFKHSIYNALVVPRPIGWIMTMDREGNINLAPYSFFNQISGTPHASCTARTTTSHTRASTKTRC